MHTMRKSYHLKRISECERSWKDKEKKLLFDKVKHVFLNLRKMKINIVRMNPNSKKWKNLLCGVKR